MSIGKFITNVGILTTLVGAISTARQARKMPRDYRRYLVWLGWLVGLALAVANVAVESQTSEQEAQR